MLAKHSIFTKMNELGAAKVPFFFMIDFLKENGEVIPLNELPDEIKFEIDSRKKEIFLPSHLVTLDEAKTTAGQWQ